MIKKIMQKHRTGCSIASIAMLAGISYKNAMIALCPNHKPYQKVSGNIFTIMQALNTLGMKITFHSNIYNLLGFDKKQSFKINKLNNPALIGIYSKDIMKYNHAVVWDPKQKKILDPGRKDSLPLHWYQRRLSFAIEIE